jgi:hypothetical protein
LVKGSNFDDAVFHFGVEEAGFGADAFALAGEEGVFVSGGGREVADVMEHPAEGAVFLILWKSGGGKWGGVFDEGEAGGKLAGAEAGLVETLAAEGAAIEHVEVLGFAVFMGEFWAVFLEAMFENFEMGFDDIGNILQQSSGALLTLVLDDDADSRDVFPFHGSCGGLASLGADFVAADVGKADGLEDVDAVNDPADLRFPVDGLEDATGGGWGDDVVGDALDLHFRSGEAGEVARDVEFDAVGHEINEG